MNLHLWKKYETFLFLLSVLIFMVPVSDSFSQKKEQSHYERALHYFNLMSTSKAKSELQKGIECGEIECVLYCARECFEKLKKSYDAKTNLSNWSKQYYKETMDYVDKGIEIDSQSEEVLLLKIRCTEVYEEKKRRIYENLRAMGQIDDEAKREVEYWEMVAEARKTISELSSFDYWKRVTDSPDVYTDKDIIVAGKIVEKRESPEQSYALMARVYRPVANARPLVHMWKIVYRGYTKHYEGQNVLVRGKVLGLLRHFAFAQEMFTKIHNLVEQESRKNTETEVEEPASEEKITRKDTSQRETTTQTHVQSWDIRYLPVIEGGFMGSCLLNRPLYLQMPPDLRLRNLKRPSKETIQVMLSEELISQEESEIEKHEESEGVDLSTHTTESQDSQENDVLVIDTAKGEESPEQ